MTRWAGFVARRAAWILVATVVVLALTVLTGVHAFGVLQGGGFNDPNSGSTRASAALAASFGGEPNVIFLIDAGSGSVDSSQASTEGVALTNQLKAEPGVSDVGSYWSLHAPGLRSNDGSKALVTAHISAAGGATADERLTAVTADLRRTAPDFTITVGGELGVARDVNGQIASDLATAEAIAVPITLILLLFAFGSLVSALLPLAISLVAIFGTFAELYVLGQLTNVSVYAVNLTTAMGLGLGIDYALLLVNRFREELDRQDTDADALARTLVTAGRTILFSGFTVACALAALLVFPLFFLRSFAYAGIGVVVIAMLAALVVLPALLALLGPRVNALRIRRRRPLRAASEESPRWRALVLHVMDRPVVYGAAVVVLLLALAFPFFHVTFATPDDRALRTGAPSRAVGDALRSDFPPGDQSALFAVVTGGSTSDAAAYVKALSALPHVAQVDSAEGTYAAGSQVAPPEPPDARFLNGSVQYLSVQGPTDPQSKAATDLVTAVRAVPPPRGATVVVGGVAAQLVDGNASIGGGLPWALALIAFTTFVILFLFTGSVVMPLKALLFNLLSLTGVFGAMVWVFQDGHGSSILDFAPRPLNTAMPVLLFCIAFGLSMDYEVFLLSRIKELRDQGAGNRDAVAGGLARTARILTTAAALLSVTFLAFMTSHVSFIQMFGLGTAIAILVDSTLVRAVLVPAFMVLMARANWWAPGPLRALHRRIGFHDA